MGEPFCKEQPSSRRARPPRLFRRDREEEEPLPGKPVIAAKEPFPVELKAGKKYAWCACGHSRSQPFCDGTHKTAAPGISPLRFTPQEDGRAWLCGCKQTRSPPFCDGTHKEEAIQSARLPPQP